MAQVSEEAGIVSKTDSAGLSFYVPSGERPRRFLVFAIAKCGRWCGGFVNCRKVEPQARSWSYSICLRFRLVFGNHIVFDSSAGF